MNNWKRHQKKWGRYYSTSPAQSQGHGSFTPKEDEPGKEFSLDEKTGLLLPETAAKERRKVKTGFQPKDKDAS